MFRDRTDAGRQLAKKLKHFAGEPNLLVFALPRGGVVTAAEVARQLNAPLDVFIVRKIGHPFQPELAVGAISETGSIVYNVEVVSSLGVTMDYLRGEAARQRQEISRRQEMYRSGRQVGELRDKTVILVDDGIATGATMKAAVEALKRKHVRKLIVAAAVAPQETALEFESMVDVFVCLYTPEYFTAVGSYYDEFRQVSDSEVVAILDDFQKKRAA